MADSAYFGRYYRLRLSQGEGDGKTLAEYVTNPGKPALDIKFDVTFCRDQHCRMGRVSILGLKLETMHSYLQLSAMSKGKALAERLRVELEAGYFTSVGATEIICGYAHYATITSPPQMWLNLEVAEYSIGSGATIKYDRSGVEGLSTLARSILGRVSKVEGVKFRFQDCTQNQICENDKKTYSFHCEGTLQEVIEQMSKGLDDRVKFILKGAVLQAYDVPTEKACKGNIDVDKDNGLLSVTGIDAVNGDVTTFLANKDPNLTFLTLTSEFNPQANGKYQIIKKQFIGHYAGPEWYVRYHCTARSKDKS